MKINALFSVQIGKSHRFESYKAGDTAFITNGFSNNGIQGFVAPQPNDRVFDFQGICVSTFCEATFQNPPYVVRGNGGSGLVVLEPLEELTREQLTYYAAYINKKLGWRFSYGRMVTKERIEPLEIPTPPENIEPRIIGNVLPARQVNQMRPVILEHEEEKKLSDLFTIQSGDFHATSELDVGVVPLISCGEGDNGLVGYFDVPEECQYSHTLTIAYNGRPLTTHYHPYTFGAKDDVAVCIQDETLPLSTLLFIQYVLNAEKWRFSYGRKCFKEKLSQTLIKLPVTKKGELDHSSMSEVVTQLPYWGYLQKQSATGVNLFVS